MSKVKYTRAGHKLGGHDETMIFFREDGWYPIQGVLDVPLAEQAKEHADINPGTLRIEDIFGTVLWRRSDA